MPSPTTATARARRPSRRRLVAPTGELHDRLHRPLRDLRISVTDRCNFRCSYCMPKEVFDKRVRFLPQSSLLSFEEIARLARLFVAHGVKKIRLTGGEPLLRRDLERLVGDARRAAHGADGEPLDLTLTTNGSVLAAQGRRAEGARASAASRSASTRSTTRSSGA